jgi:hypothetical protein
MSHPGLPVLVVAGLSLTSVDQLASPLALTREKESRNRGPEICNLPFITQLAIDICKTSDIREPAEYVLFQYMKQQGGKFGVPYPAVVDINLAPQKLSFPGLHQEPDDNMELKEVLVAGAIEEYAPDDMLDWPNEK